MYFILASLCCVRHIAYTTEAGWLFSFLATHGGKSAWGGLGKISKKLNKTWFWWV